MCDPLTLAVVGTVVTAGGAIYQGRAAQAAATYNARVAEMNAKIADRAAQDELERGAREEQRKRQEVAGIAARQRAGMAAAGLDITFGTPLEMLVDTAYAGEMDALTIRTNANRAAYNREVEAANLRAQGQMYEFEGRSARSGSMLSAVGTLAGGFGSAAGKFADTYGRMPTTKDLFA
jgi:hypothetical protein